MTPPVLLDSFPAAAEVGRRLIQRRLLLAVAESCTGGLLGAALTAVPGSSAYMTGGVIAYSNDLKRQLLDVDAVVLDSGGAVSEPVALQMAEGVRRRCHADIGVGVTGIAGPGAAGSAKPVGLIYVAVAGPGSARRVVRLNEDHGRERNRAGAVKAAIDLLMAALE